jgi:fumarate reductase flavoprotein subunit
MKVVTDEGFAADFSVPVLIVGGGGCGLTAALAARDAGADVLVLERDRTPLGTTAMSTGLIPAAGTRAQREAGIEDSPELFAGDILAKAKGQTDAGLVKRLAEESATTVDWLTERHSVGLSLVEGFLYPGHSVLRMHGMPNRSGAELMAALQSAADAAGVDILTEATAEALIVDTDKRVLGVEVERPDGSRERIGCGALILASSGFAGNRELVLELIPELEHATFHGHSGNKGHAIAWGKTLGAAMADLHAYQGHAGLAAGYGIPILWPLITEGGFQVNRSGERFANEALGYSEQAVEVLRQPDHVAWSIFDEARHRVMLQFEDYQDAIRAGALIRADTPEALAEAAGIDPEGLVATLRQVHDAVESGEPDRFGRSFRGKAPLAAPFYAVRVAGALFHTQGGLEVDGNARVLREDRSPFPNLFAGGGAARGISGPSCWGYMAGNGLLTATTLGRLAGTAAAQDVSNGSDNGR